MDFTDHYGGKKLNYYDFITSAVNDDCTEALIRMLPRIDLKKINTLIDEEEYLTSLQKSFYKYYIEQRYEKILMSAYNKCK